MTTTQAPASAGHLSVRDHMVLQLWGRRWRHGAARDRAAEHLVGLQGTALAMRVATLAEDPVAIAACGGKVVVMGMGKSGHIGCKIAATFASTGTPSFFVHPAEASHGDLGMVTPQDIVLAISNSGESSEILALIPVLKRQQITLICMTNNPESSMGKARYGASAGSTASSATTSRSPTGASGTATSSA